MVRLQKYLADAGVASRRASERVILAGRVTVNGKVVRQLGTTVDPAKDAVAVDGDPVRAKQKLYLALNKPRGYVCSRNDPSRRPKVPDLLPAEWNDVYTVGRLDLDSEGLIFLTNDGDFALRLTHPRYKVPKVYRAYVQGRVSPALLESFGRGILDQGEQLKVDRARILKATKNRCAVELVLTQGKKREVRRLFESQGLQVERLTRIQIGPIKLGELPPGRWRTLTESEIKSLLPSGPPRPEAFKKKRNE